ncbi:MAG: 1,6-anhydro-N-acetylmuramyl-L-alanine amidase AmpD [Gammaproteobacteria bacterium]|nr:MAG: 1,6-anhydro-N-acetylmuramyl-L-alanine amidase AmpD [Gammaproteobacteria bacterium]
MDRESGLVIDCQFLPSPNCDDRPSDCTEELIVLHGISLPEGHFGTPYVEQLFTNQLETTAHPDFADLEDLRVSAHIFIRRTGEVIQFVPFHKRAWHAGVSSFRNRNCCNDFSIGIELEGCNTIPYESIQYQRLTHLVIGLLRTYPSLSPDKIVGHCDIAPDRKTDPGPVFDWERFHQSILPAQHL